MEWRFSDHSRVPNIDTNKPFTLMLYMISRWNNKNIGVVKEGHEAMAPYWPCDTYEKQYF